MANTYSVVFRRQVNFNTYGIYEFHLHKNILKYTMFDDFKVF